MVDIVVNDQEVTDVVETATGDVVVETSGTTSVVSTPEASTIVVLDLVLEVVSEQSTSTVTIEQDVVTILSEGTQSNANWCLFKNVIGPAITVTVPLDSFIMGVEEFDVQGTLDNEGILVVI